MATGVERAFVALEFVITVQQNFQTRIHKDPPDPKTIRHASKLYDPFFFLEPTVSGHSYLDMLEQSLMPQMETDSTDFIDQQDGTPQRCTAISEQHIAKQMDWSCEQS
ncbi:hypothetical protein C0J52_14385 [Blattella germanica]|nr:hypothetical protein C0J52_14385 [Blattella germanica]